jgi:hypothetical protein
MNEIVRQADRSEDLLLEFARAHARSAGLPDLRKSPASPDDVELRLWHGFGLTGVEGLVLRRTQWCWSAERIVAITQTDCYERRSTPRSADWLIVWRQVETMDLAALPSKPPRDPMKIVTDGYSYVIELKTGAIYRSFVYDNPNVFRTPEDRAMVAITTHLLDAAGVSTHRLP